MTSTGRLISEIRILALPSGGLLLRIAFSL
jgi:hypothetical protein